MAIGAETGRIVQMVIGEGLVSGLTGLAVGLVGALAIGGIGSSLLFGVTATDPMTFVSVSVLLSAIALAACLVPAMRATRVDPNRALRTN
jgi:putative ABC transport system permease protein